MLSTVSSGSSSSETNRGDSLINNYSLLRYPAGRSFSGFEVEFSRHSRPQMVSFLFVLLILTLVLRASQASQVWQARFRGSVSSFSHRRFCVWLAWLQCDMWRWLICGNAGNRSCGEDSALHGRYLLDNYRGTPGVSETYSSVWVLRLTEWKYTILTLKGTGT
jgi:hypothetical protein